MATRIVFLDGYTLNPGDLDWQPLRELGDLVVHDRTPVNQIVARAQGAPIVLTNKAPLPAATLEQLPELRYIGVAATGYNVVDIAAAKQRGIPVTNIPTYGTDSVAQHTIALLLTMARQVSLHNDAVQRGEWSRNADWCFTLTPIIELTGRTLGVVGFGRIGEAVARIAAAMGMKIITDKANPPTVPTPGYEVELVDLDTLFARSDAITLHCPLTPQTQHMVNAARLAKMKPGAIILNTSRGPLIDNMALAQALRSGKLGGAGLDVLDVEPPPANHPLLGVPRCLITPHIAWYAVEARRRLLGVLADNVKAFLAGKPQNVVNHK
jgi:glycerate dehydrogenase